MKPGPDVVVTQTRDAMLLQQLLESPLSLTDFLELDTLNLFTGESSSSAVVPVRLTVCVSL